MTLTFICESCNLQTKASIEKKIIFQYFHFLKKVFGRAKDGALKKLKKMPFNFPVDFLDFFYVLSLPKSTWPSLSFVNQSSNKSKHLTLFKHRKKNYFQYFHFLKKVFGRAKDGSIKKLKKVPFNFPVDFCKSWLHINHIFSKNAFYFFSQNTS